MPVIKDGGSGNTAVVNKLGQLSVRAITEPELEDASESGQAYIWTSANLDIAAGETLLLLKNNSDTPFHITGFVVSGGNVDTRYVVHLPTTEVTVTATSPGAVVVGVNLNTGSANVADTSAASNETNNTFAQANVIFDISLLAKTTFPQITQGIILAKNKSIAIDQVTESTAGAATFVGHYEVGE